MEVLEIAEESKDVNAVVIVVSVVHEDLGRRMRGACRDDPIASCYKRKFSKLRYLGDIPQAVVATRDRTLGSLVRRPNLKTSRLQDFGQIPVPTRVRLDVNPLQSVDGKR